MTDDLNKKEDKENIKKLEKELKNLRKLNSLYKNIIQKIPLGIQIFDSKGFSVEMNDKQREMLGLASLQSGIGKFNILTNPFAKANGASDQFKKVYEGKDIEHIKQFNLGTKENKWGTRKDIIIIHESVFPIKDEKENVEFVVAIIQEKTDKDKLELDFLENEARWKYIVESNKDGLWDWNLITNKIFFSSQCKKMHGYSDDEISNYIEELETSIHPDDKLKVYEAINKHIRGETEYYENEHRILGKDGTYKWILDRGKIISYNEDNKPARMIGTHSDITERINYQTALKLSEEKYSKTFHSTPAISMLTLFENGEFIDVNQSFLDKLGYTLEETIGHKTVEIKLIDKPLRKKLIAGLLKNGSVRNEEAFFTKKSGELLPVLFSSEAFEINGIKYIYSIAIDITERKKAEEELKKHQALLKINEELSDVGAWEYDVATGNIFWTDGLYNVHEIQKEKNIDLANLSINCFLPEDREMVIAAFSKCVKEGSSYEYTVPFITCKDKKRWIKIKTQPVYEKKKIVKVIGIVADITELKEDEIKLRELNIAKEKFFSIVAHDLRNPFNAILGLSEMVYNKIKQEDIQQTAHFLSILYQSAREYYNFLDNLLQWSRIETKRLEFRPSVINLNEVIGELSDILYANIEIKRIDLETELDENIQVYADRFMLETVLRNLLTNAIKFTPENGSIKISVHQNTKQTIISVEDNGIGIKKEDQLLLFSTEQFYTSAGTNDEKGTGLGLTLCKEFITRHNGDIWVESEIGKGSKFSFSIPEKV